MCQYAESVGVDGVQVILPYYFIPTEAGAYQHYKQIAESIKIAVMVYNNPAPTGCWIKPALMAKIAKIDNVIACKENTPNLTQFVQMKKAVNPQDMTFFWASAKKCIPIQRLSGAPGSSAFTPISSRTGLIPCISLRKPVILPKWIDLSKDVAVSRFCCDNDLHHAG